LTKYQIPVKLIKKKTTVEIAGNALNLFR
jgi:hypothetical protein